MGEKSLLQIMIFLRLKPNCLEMINYCNVRAL